MNREKAMQWADALESSKYHQGQGALRSKDDKFCCLGVVCDLMRPDAWRKPGKANFNMMNKEGVLPIKIVESIQMRSSIGKRRDEKLLEIDGKRYVSLMAANDLWVKFDRIAAYIRENYEQL